MQVVEIWKRASDHEIHIKCGCCVIEKIEPYWEMSIAPEDIMNGHKKVKRISAVGYKTIEVTV